MTNFLWYFKLEPNNTLNQSFLLSHIIFCTFRWRWLKVLSCWAFLCLKKHPIIWLWWGKFILSWDLIIYNASPTTHKCVNCSFYKAFVLLYKVKFLEDINSSKSLCAWKFVFKANAANHLGVKLYIHICDKSIWEYIYSCEDGIHNEVIYDGIIWLIMLGWCRYETKIVLQSS